MHMDRMHVHRYQRKPSDLGLEGRCSTSSIEATRRRCPVCMHSFLDTYSNRECPKYENLTQPPAAALPPPRHHPATPACGVLLQRVSSATCSDARIGGTRERRVAVPAAPSSTIINVSPVYPR